MSRCAYPAIYEDDWQFLGHGLQHVSGMLDGEGSLRKGGQSYIERSVSHPGCSLALQTLPDEHLTALRVRMYEVRIIVHGQAVC